MSHGAKVTRWLLVCVLFIGVVGMHHVAMSGAMPATHVSMPVDSHGEPESPSQPHDMLNMCLAVLSTVMFLLLLAWLLIRVVSPTAQRVLATPAWPRAPGRSPPLSGRALLSAVCVLRL
jgi:hypothetical protein